MFSNDRIIIDITSLPELKNPKLICGLPGSGYVGKLAVDYLIDKLQGSRFADIHSSSFPPQVQIKSDGTLDLIKNSMFYSKTDSNDLIFLTGDAQPVSAQAEYALAEEILNVCKKLNVDSIYTLAAYITGKFAQSPRVFGTSTSLGIVKEFSKFGILTMEKGSITGMNGVIIGIAKKSNMNGTCLLGETSGYVIDAKASKAVLEILSKILDIKLDMSELNKRAEDTDQVIRSIESQAASQLGPNQPMAMTPPDEKKLDYIS